MSEPWLLLHGRHDDIVVLRDAETLAATGGGPRTLVTLEAGHGDIPSVARGAMIEALRGFVDDLVPDRTRPELPDPRNAKLLALAR